MPEFKCKCGNVLDYRGFSRYAKCPECNTQIQVRETDPLLKYLKVKK